MPQNDPKQTTTSKCLPVPDPSLPGYLAPLLLRHVISVLPLLLLLGPGRLVVLGQVAEGALVFQLLPLPLRHLVFGEEVLLVGDLRLQVLQLLRLSLLQVLPARALPQLRQLI